MVLQRLKSNFFPLYCMMTCQRFESHVIGSIDQSLCCASPHSDRALVKKVADVIWFSLSRSYKGVQAHLQSLFSYITGESFGLLSSEAVKEYKPTYNPCSPTSLVSHLVFSLQKL